MKLSEEFKEGKHSIGYVSSSFEDRFNNETFEPVAKIGRAQTLPRRMADAEIESELKPGICTFGDVLAVLDSTDPAYRDGNWNIFYFPSCVVSVDWYDGGWHVHDWGRRGSGWDAGKRVFSPASGRLALSITSDLTLESLDARLRKVERIINPDLLK